MLLHKPTEILVLVQEKQISNLQQIIREAEVRRYDELALLHEKTKLQTSEAIKGEQHYKMGLDDIRILKTELAEIVQKEFKIKEKEACYVELREILARQPGPEAAEQLAEYQRCMRNKTKQQRLVAELNVAEMSMSEQRVLLNRAATKRPRNQTPRFLTHPIFESDFDCLTLGWAATK